jgi:hypothetical protein
MANFSQDPALRIAEAITKQYVGVRLQMAVPVLDADWNLLEDLRRAELETLGGLFIGSGVPPGSDGFRISAIAQENDFAIQPGLLLARGKLTRNDVLVRYTTQPNFTAAMALSTPLSPKSFVVYLDVSEREVDSQEDVGLVDARIGVETAVRLKREWTVRVARDPEDIPALEAPALGHVHVRLARLNRPANSGTITANMIVDLRDTQLSVQRRVEVRNNAGTVVVDNPRFALMLTTARNNFLSLIRYLTTQFNGIVAPLTAGEILGLEAANHVAHTAQAGLAQLNALTLANRGALAFLRQLYDAQQNFMLVWRDHVLQLGTTTKKYASYNVFITRLNDRLNSQVVPDIPLTGLLPAINAENLNAATDTQEEINRLVGAAAAVIARGSIQIVYAVAPPGILTAGAVAQFQFRVRSNTTQADSYTVSILPEVVPPAVGWPRVLVDAAGNPIPNNKIAVGPSGTETTLFVNVTPQAAPANMGLQLRVVSDSNPAELDQISTLLTLAVGQPAPPPETAIEFQIVAVAGGTLDTATGAVRVDAVNTPCAISIRVFNRTTQSPQFTLSAGEVPGTRVGTWTVARLGPDTVTINGGASAQPGGIQVTATSTPANVQVRYVASATISGAPVTSQIVIPVITP